MMKPPLPGPGHMKSYNTVVWPQGFKCGSQEMLLCNVCGGMSTSSSQITEDIRKLFGNHILVYSSALWSVLCNTSSHVIDTDFYPGISLTNDLVRSHSRVSVTLRRV